MSAEGPPLVLERVMLGRNLPPPLAGHGVHHIKSLAAAIAAGGKVGQSDTKPEAEVAIEFLCLQSCTVRCHWLHS